MYQDTNGSFITYYDARASEYDDVYLGRAPGALDRRLYEKDTRKIGQLCQHFGSGRSIDIGCGTGFWLSYYAKNCRQIVLIDRSESMLVECGLRVKKLRLLDKCEFITGDFFDYYFSDESFGSCFVGFFISHLSGEREKFFFEKVKKILNPKSQVMLIDSAWSEARQKCREKEGMQERTLRDGRKFTLYKKYFDQSDIENVFKNHGLHLEEIYFGDVFFGVRGHT